MELIMPRTTPGRGTQVLLCNATVEADVEVTPSQVTTSVAIT